MLVYLIVPQVCIHEVNLRLPVIVDPALQMSIVDPNSALLFLLNQSCACPMRM